MINPEDVPQILAELRPYLSEICEVSLADWQWNPNSGAWVKFRLPDESHLQVYSGKDRAGRTQKFGQRYHMMLIEVNDDELPMQVEPQNPEPKPMKLSQLAGVMGTQELFRKWVTETYGEPCNNPDEAAQFIREACGIESRSMLDSNNTAGETFRSMLREFDDWKAEGAAAPGL